MADPAEKGKFSTEIGQDVIAEALKSVQRSAGTEIPVEVETNADAAEPASPEPAAPAEPPEVAALKAQLEFSLAKGRELMDKIRETHEKMLRAVADLENFKKRALKEKEEVQRFGIEKLLKDFLPVSDNLDRALEHAKTSSDFDGLRQGVQMTRKLFEDTLGKHGVRPFSAVGKPFDPRMHEAMQQQETDAMPPNHVAGEILRGYMLNDRLVRPALVMVSKAKEVAAPPVPEAPVGAQADGQQGPAPGTNAAGAAPGVPPGNAQGPGSSGEKS